MPPRLGGQPEGKEKHRLNRPVTAVPEGFESIFNFENDDVGSWGHYCFNLTLPGLIYKKVVAACGKHTHTHKKKKTKIKNANRVTLQSFSTDNFFGF